MLRVHHLASLGLVLALGCAGGDLSTSRSGSDGGGDLGDASLADASLGPPDGGLEAGSIPTADAGDLDASDPSETTGYRFGPSAAFGVTEGETDQSVASCYDGVDNDGVGGLDCGDPSCQALGACCAGSGLCCEAPSPLIPAA
ncbi:MAG: hypothetical protein OEY14_07830, partial [Myxococcales bacterium]|nr:hypothetical protein [Myxococcales bacterium]